MFREASLPRPVLFCKITLRGPPPPTALSAQVHLTAKTKLDRWEMPPQINPAAASVASEQRRQVFFTTPL